MTYKDELKKAMQYLATNEDVIFLGQTARYSGSPMNQSLEGISEDRRFEMPIIEDTQMGMSIGLALLGYIPVSLFPRFDFLLCATNQLVNHLDKTYDMSNREFNPRVIIRTGVGSTKPFYPGIQHCSDYTDAFRSMLKNTDVIKLEKTSEIVPAYEFALNNSRSTLLIEQADLYDSE